MILQVHQEVVAPSLKTGAAWTLLQNGLTHLSLIAILLHRTMSWSETAGFDGMWTDRVDITARSRETGRCKWRGHRRVQHSATLWCSHIRRPLLRRAKSSSSRKHSSPAEGHSSLAGTVPKQKIIKHNARENGPVTSTPNGSKVRTFPVTSLMRVLRACAPCGA